MSVAGWVAAVCPAPACPCSGSAWASNSAARSSSPTCRSRPAWRIISSTCWGSRSRAAASVAAAPSRSPVANTSTRGSTSSSATPSSSGVGAQSASSPRTARQLQRPASSRARPRGGERERLKQLGGEPHGRLGGGRGTCGAGQQTLGGLELAPLVGAPPRQARYAHAAAGPSHRPRCLARPHSLRAELLGAAQLAAHQVHERELGQAVHRDLLVALLGGERERLLQVGRGGERVTGPQLRGPQVGERGSCAATPNSGARRPVPRR